MHRVESAPEIVIHASDAGNAEWLVQWLYNHLNSFSTEEIREQLATGLKMEYRTIQEWCKEVEANYRAIADIDYKRNNAKLILRAYGNKPDENNNKRIEELENLRVILNMQIDEEVKALNGKVYEFLNTIKPPLEKAVSARIMETFTEILLHICSADIESVLLDKITRRVHRSLGGQISDTVPLQTRRIKHISQNTSLP